jgi:hypothetical protein
MLGKKSDNKKFGKKIEKYEKIYIGMAIIGL